MVMWIENQYTLNSKYPTQEEFESQFPDFRNHTYTEEYAGFEQDFSLSYHLGVYEGERKSYALGEEKRIMPMVFGPIVYYYEVKPCSRWGQLGLIGPETSYYVAPPTSGSILTDFDKGTVYFKYSNSNEKIPLLTNLIKPRVFDKANDKIVVTNGKNVYLYDFYRDSFDPRVNLKPNGNIKLLNPQKIGEVPTGCPVGYLGGSTNKWLTNQ